MPEGLMWRTLSSLNATAADFVIVLLGFMVVAGMFYHHLSTQRQINEAREQIGKLKERYHRLDALCLVQAKVLQIAVNKKVKIVKESVTGDGDYSLDRGID